MQLRIPALPVRDNCKKTEVRMVSPISELHDYNINVGTNEIFLFGEEGYIPTRESNDGSEPGVEYVMANKFIRNLTYLQHKSDHDILIHMKTCGGDWHEGMAIYDAIRKCPNHVKIISYTHARSMSSIILQAADERIMHKHSMFMFHMGTMTQDGTNKQFFTEAEVLKQQNEQMLDIYIHSMQAGGCMQEKTKAQIRNWLIKQMDKREDVYLTAKEAIEYGFADRIIGN